MKAMRSSGSKDTKSTFFKVSLQQQGVTTTPNQEKAELRISEPTDTLHRASGTSQLNTVNDESLEWLMFGELITFANFLATYVSEFMRMLMLQVRARVKATNVYPELL